MPSQRLKLVALLSITLITAWSLLLPASAWRYVNLGTQGDFQYTSWSRQVKQIIIPVQLSYGDIDNWHEPLSVCVAWDDDAVVVSLVVVHMIGVKDDRNRLVAWFGDAEAGGTAAKTAPPQCTGGLEVCYVYEVKTVFKHFYSYSVQRTSRAVIFVTALSEAEAQATVEAMLRRIALSYSISSIVKIGSIYEVAVSFTGKYKTTFMLYDGRIEYWEHNYKNGERRLIGVKTFQLAPYMKYYMPVN